MERLTLPRRIAGLLEKRPLKFALALLIIVSLLPVPSLERALRPVFILVFGAEIILRTIALTRPRTEIRRFEWFFLFIDFLAFASFLPLENVVGASYTDAFVALRLTRLALLLRFARELAADVYSIITRREQLQQFGLVTIGVFSLAFGSAVVLQHLPLRYDYSGLGENPGFLDRLWWAFRQLQSADNLVPNLHVPVPIAILSLALTIIGVFVVSFIIGIGTNVVDQVVRAERRRPVDYHDHSVVIGPVHQAEMLVAEFVRLYERNRILRRWFRPAEVYQWLLRRGPKPNRHALPRMALLGTTQDPPSYLYDPEMRWVVYREGDGWDPEALERISAQMAKRALILSRFDAGPDADAVTSMALASFRAQNTSAQVFVEVTESSNRSLMEAIGGPHTFPLDMPRFLGLFLCQHLVTPGVEALYTDLMTADGSEFYTHIFTEKRELEAVSNMSADGFISFEHLARHAYRERSVLLVGVFLGDELPKRMRGLVPIASLEQWLNPLHDPPEESGAWKLGARAGQIPVDKLRGLIGVTATYAPLRRYGRDLVMGSGIGPSDTNAALDPKIMAWANRATMARGLLSRVVIVGYSAALPSMLHELAHFMPGVDATLILGERGDERLPLGERIASLGMGIASDAPLPGRLGNTLPLAHGGNVTVFTHHGQDLASFAVECAQKGGPVGAVVFLSEPDAIDRDARTTMRLLRFARALERGDVPRGDKLHILAEFASVQKGEHVRRLLDGKRCGFASSADLRLSLVSTERIKNYFMVHSAFVPGVTGLYDEILSEYGQEIVRFDLDQALAERLSGHVHFEQIREAFGARKVLPIALEQLASEDSNGHLTPDGFEIVLNPEPDQIFDLSGIRGIYGVAESRDFEGIATISIRQRLLAGKAPESRRAIETPRP
ncbi:MAG: hypothetical protein IPM54_35420 [Polyangiaceae bacterium]|nr:hypothetical protein [Polyangiaceae bacterium]